MSSKSKPRPDSRVAPFSRLSRHRGQPAGVEASRVWVLRVVPHLSVPSWVTVTSQSGPLKRAPGCSAHLPPVSLDGCGRAARRDAAGVARGRCGAGEEGASLGGERQEEAPGRSRGCQLLPSRASALGRPAGFQPSGPVGRERGPPEPPLPAGATGWVFTLGRHPPPRALRRAFRAASVTAAAPPVTSPLPLRELSARRPWPKEEEEGSRRGLVWPPSPARPAPARTPSPASYFRTRKVRAAPGDSAAAPVPGSRVCSRVARRTVQTPPWLRPPPAPGSPTSISSSRSSESKRPCLASPPRDP